MTISNDDIRDRSQALHEVQEMWEEILHLATPKIPCNECFGEGQVFGGSLGNICPKCLGARVIAAPGRHELPPMPDFQSLRLRLSAYGDAVATQSLPPGHPNRVEMPDVSTVPTLDEIEALRTRGEELVAQLGPANHPAPAQLGTYRDPEATPTDEDLDALEDEVERDGQ